MSDKPVAVLVAALVAAPLCATCILGPAVVGTMIAGSWGWFWGNRPLVAVAVVVMAILIGYALKRRQFRPSEVSANARGVPSRPNVETSGELPHE